jgi:hypothetical protein
VLSRVRRTGRRSSVPLASRPSGNRFDRFPTNAGPRRSRMICFPPWTGRDVGLSKNNSRLVAPQCRQRRFPKHCAIVDRKTS